MRAFKQQHFGQENIVLHTVDLGKGRDDYAFLSDPMKRAAFYSDLNALLGRWDYKVVVCGFELYRFAQMYANPADLSRYGLEILIERFCLELGTNSTPVTFTRQSAIPAWTATSCWPGRSSTRMASAPHTPAQERSTRELLASNSARSRRPPMASNSRI